MNCKEAIDVMDHVLDDTLEPDLRPGFREHMTICVPCRTYFDQLQLTVKALHRLPREESPNPRRNTLIDEFIQEYKRDPE